MESLRESLVKWPVRGKLTRLSAFGCAAEGVRRVREDNRWVVPASQCGRRGILQGTEGPGVPWASPSSWFQISGG